MADEGAFPSREAALFQAWLRLEDHDAAHPGQPFAKVLHLRQARRGAPVAVLAEEFSVMVGSPVSPEQFRKILQQARRMFLELLTELGHGRP